MQLNHEGEITISLKKIGDGSFSEEDQKKEKILISIEDNGTGIHKIISQRFLILSSVRNQK